MKHAGGQALDSLQDLLSRIREFSNLNEKGRGVFYLKSTAFLHFHEDPSGLFADLKSGSDWARLPVNSRIEQDELVSKIDKVLAGRPQGRLITK